MRHAIQKAGHECLPLLFMLVAWLSPGWIVVPVLVTLAICTEWLTFTFNQDMQDAFTARRGRGFPVLRALLASTVSTFIFATASSGLWAPRGANDKALWAWILAVGVFGSQLLLKLVPEKAKAPHSLQNIAAAIEEWMPEASVEEQARVASRVYNAVSGSEIKALPEAGARLAAVEAQPIESEAAKNGTGRFPG